jgi:hypothetical protein
MCCSMMYSCRRAELVVPETALRVLGGREEELKWLACAQLSSVFEEGWVLLMVVYIVRSWNGIRTFLKILILDEGG